MSMSERGMPRRFWPGNATKFLHRRSMELVGLCLLTLAFSLLLINLTYNSADPSFNTIGSSATTKPTLRKANKVKKLKFFIIFSPYICIKLHRKHVPIRSIYL